MTEEIIDDQSQVDFRTRDNTSENTESKDPAERALELVKDINAYGTAFTCLTSGDSLKNVMKSGLLGVSREFIRDLEGRVGAKHEISASYGSYLAQDVQSQLPAEWAKYVRETGGTDAYVYFNIVGRMSDTDNCTGDRNPIANSYYFRAGSSRGVIFDLDTYRESTLDRGNTNAYHTYQLNEDIQYILKREYGNRNVSEHEIQNALDRNGFLNQRGDTTTGSDYGFRFIGRIPPRNITGIIARVTRSAKLRGEFTQACYGEVPEEYQDPTKRKELIEKIREQLITSDYDPYQDPYAIPEIIGSIQENFREAGKECSIPIYDVKGNLLWPKQMNRSELLKYLEDKNNK